jgi:Ca-activated chloride channel homolog
LLTLKLRYKAPDGETSRLLSFPVVDAGGTLGAASADFKFAGAVAAFGMILRHSPHVGTFGLEQVQALAREGLGPDPGGYRAGFVDLVERAKASSGR